MLQYLIIISSTLMTFPVIIKSVIWSAGVYLVCLLSKNIRVRSINDISSGVKLDSKKTKISLIVNSFNSLYLPPHSISVTIHLTIGTLYLSVCCFLLLLIATLYIQMRVHIATSTLFLGIVDYLSCNVTLYILPFSQYILCF